MQIRTELRGTSGSAICRRLPDKSVWGNYAPCRYKYHGNVKAASNTLEDPPHNNKVSRYLSMRTSPETPLSDARPLLPRRINILGSVQGIYGPPEVQTFDTAEWISTHPEASGLPYLFVSYTSEHFNLQTQQVWDLQDLSVRATQEAGLSAYWSSANCIGESEFENDVYHINDAIRASSGVAVILPDRADDPGGNQRLREWASRVWTFPEIILSPAHRTISVWAWPNMAQPLRVLPKNQFAALVWSDSIQSRQLIDHYEGSLILSRLQLPSIALSCLYSRSVVNGNRPYHLPGDHAYALSGLLNSRPVVDQTDCAFQAFARLSLANDSDKLLERLVCTLPKSSEQAWHDMTDAWDVSLWNLHPRCEVSAVCHEDTVLIDGARGASVEWGRLPAVASIRPVSRKVKMVRGILVLVPTVMHAGLSFLIAGGALLKFKQPGSSLFFGIGGALVGLALLFQIFAPLIVRRIYGTRATDYDAHLIGIEGYMSIEKLERKIFPEAPKRLVWSSFGSPYSSHSTNKYGECVGCDPKTVPELWERIQSERAAGRRLFTLVDTATMTASLFTAERPPTSFIVCGSEGGMQRAVGVSYDWTTQTLYKETVLRMETTAVERMTPVPRFRFGFKRKVVLERSRKNGSEFV